MNLGETLNVAGDAIEEANPGRLDGVLGGTNWNDDTKLGSPANRESIIRRLLNHFSDLDLSDRDLSAGSGSTGNVLGDAYEYLINQFADDAGKKGGEFYTPRSVVRLIVELLQPQEGMRICDPTLGSAGMLIFTADHVRENGGNPQNLVLHGQERNLGTLAIGKLNMLLHGLPTARLEPGDVIAEPGLLDETGRLLSYDRVIANPPFSLKNWGSEFAPHDPHHRFDRYGAAPPKTRGDFAFLLHMLGVTNAQGMVGVVIPHGVLFRGGAEGKIRRGIVEADLFEAIIGLAPNLFFGASIPVAVCVLNRDKPQERRGKVLFIDAAQEGYFQPGKAQNYIEREHIGEIVEAYRAFEDVERLAHVADLDEIQGNDFNLNISRYVDTTEPVEVMSGGGGPGPTAGGGAAPGRGGGPHGPTAGRDGVCTVGFDQVMPVLLREGPYRFYIVSWDRNEPPHVHVRRDASFAKFWLDPVELQESGNFRGADIRRIQRIIEQHQTHLLEAWHGHFDR